MKHPNINLLHFLNANYFLQEEVNKNKLLEKIKEVVYERDEHGLHIHCWKNLVLASNVEFRSSPSWNKYSTSLESCTGDCGHGVPLWAYKKDEIRKIIRKSKQVLSLYGFKQTTSFRAGGWMASRKVLKVLSEEGFQLDASAVPVKFLVSSQPIISTWVKQIWPHTSIISQPYQLNFSESSIIEFPNNACLADYMTAKMMYGIIEKNIELWRRQAQKSIFISIGFHQETAAKYLNRITRVIDLIRKNEKISNFIHKLSNFLQSSWSILSLRVSSELNKNPFTSRLI